MNWRDVDALGGNGTLTSDDVKELNAGVVKVLEIMSDGAWHTIQELRDKTGLASADRRMRQLRDLGYKIRLDRPSKSRFWYYRLVMLDDCFETPPPLPAEGVPPMPPGRTSKYAPETWKRMHDNNRMMLCEVNRIVRILEGPDFGNHDSAREALLVAQRILAAAGVGDSPDGESRKNLFNRKD